MTRYVEVTGYEQATFADRGRCNFCGTKEGSDSMKCICRECPECSREWYSDYERDFREFDCGGRATIGPAREVCPDCEAIDEAEWMPALVEADERIDEHDTLEADL